MHLSAIATILLLPLAAVAKADSSPLITTTCTSYLTLTQTVTLQRAAVTTVSASNNTATFTTPTLKPSTASNTPIPTNAGSALGAAHVAFVAVAGAAFAVFL